MKPARPKSRRRMLGLAVGEKSMLVAEVMTGSSAFPVVGAGSSGGASAVSGAFEAVRLAEFTYPQGVTLDQGEELGQALAQFLKSNGFSTRHAVMGIPAKWVVVKPKHVPPAEPAVVAETLRLQAEGEFSQGLNELVYDYAGRGSVAESRQVLLMATPRRYVDQLLAVADAARLDVSAVTPSAAALGWATSRSGAAAAGSSDALVLVLGTAGAEFTAQCGSSPCALRHLGPTPAAPPSPLFLSELRRTASLLPAVGDGRYNGSASGASGAANGRELVVWNGFSTDLAARKAVGESLGIPVRAGDLDSLGVASPNDEVSNPAHFAPAVALAVSGLGGAFAAPVMEDTDEAGAVPADFLHPRLAPPKERRVDRRIVWGVVAGVALVALFVTLFVQQTSRKHQLEAIQAELKRRDPEIKSAKSDVEMVSFVTLKWQGGTPKFLPCLRDLTRYMPTDGQTFLTSFDLHDDMKGNLVGKTNSNDNALNVGKSLKASAQFADVETKYSTRQTDRNGLEVTFTINFTYVGKD